jgi:hypothetical protein
VTDDGLPAEHDGLPAEHDGLPAEDDELMAELARIAVLADPPPDLVGAAGRAALTTRRLDEELARLVEDSALGAVALVRGGDTVRLLTFEHGDVSLELQVEQVGGRVTVRGLILGATGPVTVDTPTGERTARIGPEGWFSIDDLPTGPLCVRLRAADGTGIRTGWIAG